MATYKIRLTLDFTPERLELSIFYFISYNKWDFEGVKISNSL